MANESVQNLLDNLQKKLDVIVIVVLVLLTLAVGKLSMDEQRRRNVDVPQISEPALDPIISPESLQTAQRVVDLNRRIEKDESYVRLIRSNMFQVLTLEDRKALEQKVSSLFDRAQKLFQENKLDEARKVCVEIQNNLPAHRPTQELLKKINEQLAQQAQQAQQAQKK